MPKTKIASFFLMWLFYWYSRPISNIQQKYTWKQYWQYAQQQEQNIFAVPLSSIFFCQIFYVFKDANNKCKVCMAENCLYSNTLNCLYITLFCFVFLNEISFSTNTHTQFQQQQQQQKQLLNCMCEYISVFCICIHIVCTCLCVQCRW